MHARLIFVWMFSSAVWGATDAEKLARLLERDWSARLRADPDFATSRLGRHERMDEWTDRSAHARAEWNRRDESLWEEMLAIDLSKLDRREQLNYRVYRYSLRRRLDSSKFPNEKLAIDLRVKNPAGNALRALNAMPTETLADYEAILRKLRAWPGRLEQTQEWLRQGVRSGVTVSRLVAAKIPPQLDLLAPEDPAKSPLLAPFTRYPGTISAEERERLTRESKALLDGAVRPAVRQFRDYLRKTYVPACRTTTGMSELPNGKAWYAATVADETTTALKPEEIHTIGLKEIERIQAEMRALMRKSGFAGELPAFFQFLKNDSQFFYSSNAELLAGYRDIAKRIDPELARLFGRMPTMPYGVKAMEAFMSQASPQALYSRGSPPGNLPGWFLVNLRDLKDHPKWAMEALTLHEAVPGHHLQLGVQDGLDDLPEFRRALGVGAFSEGWGLYAESLGEELGLYQDGYSKMGRLTFDAWRASRLVVDTGLHALGWPRERAVEYLRDNTSLPENLIQSEVDRYIAEPGQALAYKLGELKFRNLRALAERELGPGFRVREFHDFVLKNGALPLDILDEEVRRFIAEKKSAGRKTGTPSIAGDVGPWPKP